MTRPPTRISSVHNPRVRLAVRLRERRQRDRQGRILIDGAREIARAVQGGVTVRELFVCPERCTSDAAQRAVSLVPAGVDLWQVTPEVLERLVYGQRNEGLLAVADAPAASLAQFAVAETALVAVLVGIEKPGNVGAVLRSADAAGAGGVLVVDGGTDLFNPNCIRASLGTVFTLPVAGCRADEALAWLVRRGGPVYAARVDAKRLYTQADFRGPAAVVLGSEAAGLDERWREPPLQPIRLPMLGQADSLNVSATAAVLFYEAWRQRTS